MQTTLALQQTNTDNTFHQVTESDVCKLHTLLEQRDVMRDNIIGLANRLKGEDRRALDYLQNAGRPDMMHAYPVNLNVSNALKQLDADYWEEAIKITKVFAVMPAKRRQEWNEQIKSCNTPEFVTDTVIPTLVDLLNKRVTFFAERIAGVFENLSKTHVTNDPAAFTKRFIIKGVLEHKKARGIEWYETKSSVTGIVDDLRKAVGVLSGRCDFDTPSCGTFGLFDTMANLDYFGQWIDADGGAIRLKVFKVGTVHIEVHPEIAGKMNDYLATIYPSAIPDGVRKKPKTTKTFKAPVTEALPMEVIAALNKIKARSFQGVSHTLYTPGLSAPAEAQVIQVLQNIGATLVKETDTVLYFNFDYDPTIVLAHLVITGEIPDKQSHQFYETQAALSERAAEQLGIEAGRSYLEPQAGHGALASHLPKDSTTLVEISPLRAKILQAKGFNDIHCADFLAWSQQTPQRFDGILSNPPYHQGMAQAHIEAALPLLKEGGRLVAIVPANLKNCRFDGYSVYASEALTKQFPDAAVTVVILTIDKL